MESRCGGIVRLWVEQALGRELTGLIIPAEFRSLHWAGMQRVGGGGTGSILGRRIEVIGQRADRSQFPVELTITGVELGDRLIFAGYLRDLTERRQMLADLRASRGRLVAVSDEARRRVERDLHDGAQQQLVGLAIMLTSARAVVADDADAAGGILDRASRVLREAIGQLRELARGVHPSVLTDRGLSAALTELGRRSAIPLVLGDLPDARFPTEVESAAYFVVAEALTNASKHGASTTRVTITVAQADAPMAIGVAAGRWLVCSFGDDGPGGADPDKGSGLRGLMDRLAAVDGYLQITSPLARGPC